MNNNGGVATAPAAAVSARAHDDGRYTVDIRVFLALIVTSMAISFGIGVGLGPTATQLFHQSSATFSANKNGLPTVTSVDMGTPLDKPMSIGGGTEGEDVHEPAGQVRCVCVYVRDGLFTIPQTGVLTLAVSQHLLVDIKGIEADFLDSEARLSQAMVQTVEESGLTLLSYHCHKLIPKGVSCVGVLLESHISFHTWPDEGVITLDLFTCGNKPLIPAVAILKQLFGIPRAPDSIHMQWSHELRGFRNKKQQQQQQPGTTSSSTQVTTNYAVLDHNSDLSQMIWSPMDVLLKEQIVSQLTKYQRVDIWDLVGLEETPSYDDAIRAGLEPGDERWMTAEVVSPNRYFFLDGVMQSDTESYVQQHEAMVHPAMFSHPNPQKVAIGTCEHDDT